MTELSYRVPKETPERETAERNRRLKATYDAYAAANPYPGSRHSPPLYIEAFPSERPYTEHGKVRGVAWLPEGKTTDSWWLGAISAVMQTLLEEFPDRGVSIRYDDQGSALKLLPAPHRAKA